MNGKTCGECKHFYEYEDRRAPCCWSKPTDNACLDFEPKVITNGDKIIAGGMRALAEFHGKLACDVCAYRYDHRCIAPQGRPLTCVDGIEAWLNAPAESEKTE